jgi:LmbE family N-acetylglucosaminyl deacetylase
MKVLLSIGAHPDDASIFYGGTLARHVAEGWRVTSVTVDEGRGSPHSFEMTPDELVAARASELRWEALRLGVANEHLSMPGVKSPITRQAAMDKLVALVEKLRPVKVICHHLEDAHATHVACARLALAAVAKVFGGTPDGGWPEIWQADGWEPVHYPDVRVDVTAYMNLKMAAISQHGTQIFVMGAWGLCLYRAGFASSHEVTDPACVFAEAFRTLTPQAVREVAAGYSIEEG